MSTAKGREGEPRGMGPRSRGFSQGSWSSEWHPDLEQESSPQIRNQARSSATHLRPPEISDKEGCSRVSPGVPGVYARLVFLNS